MDIASIKQTFSKELEEIRQTSRPKFKRYSRALKTAILELNAEGKSLADIRRGLDLPHSTLSTIKRKNRAQERPMEFTPIKVLHPSRSELVIELPSGVRVRIF